MSLSSRLQKVTQNLSPLQRAVLMLRALKEGREPDPDLRRIADEHERRAFNRYASLIWISNHHLGAVAGIIEHRVDLIEKASHYYDLFNQAADLIDEAEGEPRTRGYKDWRKRKEITASTMLRSLALECREEATQLLVHLWKELGAQEMVRADLAAEFDGEDVLLPDYRDQVDRIRDRLFAAADGLGARKLLAEPDDEFVAQYERVVNEAFKQLHLTEPYQ